MKHRGKWLVVFVFGLGIAAAAGGIYYNHRATHRTIGWLGGAKVLSAPRVELLQLAPLGDDAPIPDDGVIRAAGARFAAVRSVDITQARGVLNMRHALAQDVSYAWDEAPKDQHIAWAYAVRFTGDGRSDVLVFDAALRHVCPGDGSQVVVLTEKIRDGLAEFFKENLAEREQ
jgi:hypothetical protein